MIDTVAETGTSLGISREPVKPALRQEQGASHLDMAGRATPLVDNPALTDEQGKLREAFGQIGDQPNSLANQLFSQAGVNASTEIPSKPKNQGFFVQIWEAIKNFLKNLFG